MVNEFPTFLNVSSVVMWVRNGFSKAAEVEAKLLQILRTNLHPESLFLRFYSGLEHKVAE